MLVGSLDMPKRSRKVLSLSEKVKVLDLIRHFIVSHHHKKKSEDSTIRYFQNNHIHITFITIIYCCNCSILLVIVNDL